MAGLIATPASAALVLGGIALADTDGPWPANINPQKTPATTATPIAEEPDPLSERLEAARTYIEAAKDDPGLVVCLTAEGTLAGLVSVDRPSSAPPFTRAEKQAACERLFPGSHG
jgi:hypothetical protein